MKPTIKALLILISFVITILSHAQVKTNDTIHITYVGSSNYEIEASSIRKNDIPHLKEFQGAYHFGESEGEYTLTLLYRNRKLYANNFYNEWDNQKNTWRTINDDLPCYYENGKIYIKNSSYELYTCIKETLMTLNEGTNGLVSEFYSIEGGKIHHYTQFSEGRPIILYGNYPETSKTKLTIEILKSYTKKDLKIMRNEIFARYGHVFKKGGVMDTHFSLQDWYATKHFLPKDTNSTIPLSNIEKHNVTLIQALE